MSAASAQGQGQGASRRLWGFGPSRQDGAVLGGGRGLLGQKSVTCWLSVSSSLVLVTVGSFPCLRSRKDTVRMRELRFAEVDLVQVQGLGFACPPGTCGHVPPWDPSIVLRHQEQNLLNRKVSGCNAVWSRLFTVGDEAGPRTLRPGRAPAAPALPAARELESAPSRPPAPLPPSSPSPASPARRLPTHSCRETLSKAIFTTSFLPELFPVAFLFSFLALKAGVGRHRVRAWATSVWFHHRHPPPGPAHALWPRTPFLRLLAFTPDPGAFLSPV